VAVGPEERVGLVGWRFGPYEERKGGRRGKWAAAGLKKKRREER
jgi:hypothetical protein